MSAVLGKWGEWIRFGLTLGAIASFAVLDNRFVSQGQFQLYRERQDVSIQALQTSMALMEASTKALADHESRIRTLEARRLSGNFQSFQQAQQP